MASLAPMVPRRVTVTTLKVRVSDLFEGAQFRTIHTGRAGKTGVSTYEGVACHLDGGCAPGGNYIRGEDKILHRDVLVLVDYT